MPISVRKRLVLLAYALSGACALVYQLVWYHYFIDHLGATSTTYLVVLCTFIGGLGVGAVLSKRVTGWLARHTPFDDLRLYGLIEIFICLFVILLIGLTRIPLDRLVGVYPYRTVTEGYLILHVPTGLYQFLKIGLALVAVGVPCFLMGLTYPYLCSLFPEDDRFPSHLYALNTFGACLAVLAAEFLGFTTIGYSAVLALGAIANLLIGVFFIASKRFAPPDLREAGDTGLVDPPLSVYPAVLSGFLCGGLEALAFILIKLTYFSAKGIFALMSFHAIASIWLASTIVHRFKPSRRALAACSWLALAWCVSLWFTEPRLGHTFVVWSADHVLQMPSYLKGVLVTFIYTAFYISLPYGCLSLLLPALCDAKQANRENLSATYGLNTIAFLTGVLLFGWLLQYANPFYAARLFAVAAAAGLVLLSSYDWRKTLTLRTVAVPVVIVALGLALTPGSLAMRLIGGLPVGPTPTLWQSTPQHLFWVKLTPDGRPEALMFDRHPMSAIDKLGQRYMRLMADLPLLTHPQPRSTLLICYGVGNTADALRMFKTVERVDVVDLNPTVYRLTRAFRASNHDVLADPKMNLIVDDGRQFLKLSTNRYDLVTLEPPPPLNPGISRLYSREFYQDVRARLSDGGFISQWLPEDILTGPAVDLIVSTFIDTFPDAFCFCGAGRTLILVGSNTRISLEHLRERFADEPRVREDLHRFGIEDSGQLLASIMDTPETLRAKWSGGSLIQDGRISLDTIVISPVQFLDPRQERVPFKPNLRVDPAAVRVWLATQSPALATEYELAYSALPTQEVAGAILPLWYRK